MLKFLKRCVGEKIWYEISEEDLHHSLYKECKQTTPLIKRMLNGEKFIIDNDEYKIELKRGNNG